VPQGVRIESVVTDDVAQAILDRLARDYFERFAVVAWLSTVQVARGERF
jgi:nitrogen regulatory protein P-II 2